MLKRFFSNRWWYLLLFSIILILGLIISRVTISKKFKVDFLDVGQGDAALLVFPNRQTILIDGGPDNSLLRYLGEDLPFYRRRLDFLIFSHYHTDHITGLIEVLNRYQVGKIIYAPSDFNSPTLTSFWKAVFDNTIPVQEIVNRATLNLSHGCRADFLNPKSFGAKKDPNNSLLVKIDCLKKSILFTGDNNADVEKKLLASDWDLKADVLKEPHHGSNSAGTKEFLQAVNPSLTVISVGANNHFGHPSPSLLRRLEALHIKYWRTDLLGNLKMSWTD